MDIRIAVDHVGHGIDQFDDQFGQVVGRCRLSGEDDGARHHVRLRGGFDAVKKSDDVEHIEQLAFVFVDALDLDIEQGVGIDAQFDFAQDVTCQSLFIGLFGGHPPLAEVGVFGIRNEFLQPFQIADPIRTDDRGDQGGEFGIALGQPASGCDAVGDIAETAGIERMKIAEQFFLQDLAVQFGYAIDGMTSDDGQMGHAHMLHGAFTDQRDPGGQSFIARTAPAHRFQEPVVDLENDLHVARQQPGHEIHRPGFKRLGQHGVVGIGEGLLADPPRLVPSQSLFVHEQPHEFRNRDAGMGVVELNGDKIGQIGEGTVQFAVAAQNIVQRGGHKEVLLFEPQLLAPLFFVARVKYL